METSRLKPLLIGILGFDGVATLDLAGPLEAFTTAKIDSSEGIPQRCYHAVLIGVTGRTFVSESGATFKAAHTLDSAPELDTVVIPGGLGIRRAQVTENISHWLTGEK